MRILFLGLFIFVNCYAALAADTSEPAKRGMILPPHFRTIGSTTTNNVLSMTCEGKAPYETIQCHFTKIVIRKMTEEKKQKFRKENAERLEEMSQKEFAEYVSYLSDPNDLKKIEERLSIAPTSEKKTYMKDVIDSYKLLASAKGKDQQKEALKKNHQMNEDTCTISLKEFDLTFQRITKNRWVSNPGPVGICNVIRVAILENMKEHDILWEITETTVSSDNDGLCEGIQNDKPTIYSWDAPKNLMLGCKYLSFGM